MNERLKRPFREELGKQNQHSVIDRPAWTDETLRERVKELECLYAIAQVSVRPDATLSEVMQRVVTRLPVAWRFPEHACAWILIDDLCVGNSARTAAGPMRMTAGIEVRGVHRGEVSVGYPSGAVAGDASPFMEEEHRLLTEVARQVAQIVERLETLHAQNALRDQLRHAERLVTIGQLASGVAHELNEPLSGILGFAQLIAKTPRLPRTARNDLEKIKVAALLAREIIRKLMVFAHQSPPCFAPVDINRLIEESMGLLLWRCEDSGIRVKYALDPTLPELVADGAQIQQVVINLVLNAIQAMPAGGLLTLATVRGKTQATINISDAGSGMPPHIRDRIFDPFFTTKEPGHGTGLGLSVVHGIIAAHGGRIDVDSQPAKGTRFKIRLPLRELPTKNSQGA